jgi:glycosyltransferase involved in cell wall biosynthesis
MVIVLVNQYAGAGEMEHRPFYLAREWTRRGHRVVVVAASFSHLRGRNPEVRGRVLVEQIEGIDYLWVKTPSYSGNGIRRALNILVFVAQLMRLRGELVSAYRPDVVIASSTHPLDIYPASDIARRAAGKLVFEVHDLWPLTPIEVGGLSAWHPFIALMRAAESFAYRRADRVISILPNAESYMRQRGMAPEKFLHIPNGVDVAEWCDGACRLVQEHQMVIRKLKEKNRFLVGYAGAHGVTNALGSVVQAAERLRDRPVSFVLVGRGPEKAMLCDEARARRLENIVFLPPVPKTMIPALLREMDALYIGLKNKSLFRFGISPNKLIDYMMAGKPVIQAINASNDLVGEAGCGYTIPAEDVEALVDAVLRMMASSETQREEMGRNGRQFAERRHSYAVLAERFLASVS